MALLLVLCVIVYGAVTKDPQLNVDPASYAPLLQLIAEAESRGNYNAYFGNAGNTEVQFTSMTISEVLKWQRTFIENGSPSSAVGKYQFLNTTLEGLADELNLKDDTVFNEVTQDRMAIALLERRGARAYVNQQITRDEFGAELAKEWAALPKVIGDTPEQSYYAGDGLNSSHVTVEEVRTVIGLIRAQR